MLSSARALRIAALGSRSPARGFTLIEVMISLAVLGIVVMLALPSFSDWIQNSQIRVAAEAGLNGLQTARSEAIRRNLPVQLAFGPNTGWTVSEVSGGALTAITSRTHEEGSRNVVVESLPAAGLTTVTFTALGSIAANADASATPTGFDFTNPAGGTCQGLGGPMRCLRVTISGGGTVKMCDPQVSSPDPRGC